jgi:PAS domain-containing protein
MGVPLATSPQSDASAHIKRLFMAVTLALVAAASYSSWLVVQRQDALREVSRYNATWLLMQAAQEVSRLEAMVGRLLITGSDEDRERVQLWADIVANRAQLLDSGEVGEFLRLNPDLKQTVDDVRETIGATLPSERTIQQPVELRRQMNRLATLNPKLMRLASAAYTRSGEMAAADVEQLGRLHWLLSGLLGGLILCSAGLVSVMTWHNKLLARTHQEVQALVADLRRSGAELAEANLRTTRAMEETHRQNETLRQRDDELKLQNARFDAALNNMSQALCMVDSNQHLIVCNVRFLELFGLTEEMAVPGTPMAEVFRAITANSCFAHTLIDAVRIEQQALVFVHRWGRFQR